MEYSILTSSHLETPLGPMLAVADERALHLLEFIDYRNLKQEVARLKIRTKSTIVSGTTEIINSIEKELKAYFEGRLRDFKTPLFLSGSPFQKQAWEALMRIPHGETRSYAEQAHTIGKPSAYRAVANANGANQIAIVIPCHRIINSNGKLGGYGGGVDRKKWLIQFEKSLPQS